MANTGRTNLKKGGDVVKARVGKMMRKEKEPQEPQQLVQRTPGSPLKLFSKYKKVPQSSLKPTEQFGTSLEKERAKKARIEHRTKVVKDKGSKTSKEKLSKIFGEGFESWYERRGKKGLTRGKKEGGIAKKQGGGAMYSRGYGVGEPSRRTPTALLDRGSAYKKGGVIKAESGILATKAADMFKKARKRYSGRLKKDDLDPTKSTARERAIASTSEKKKPKKSLMEMFKPKASVAGPHRDIVGRRRLKTLLGKLPNAKPAKVGVAGKIREALGYKGGGIAKRGLGIIKKG